MMVSLVCTLLDSNNARRIAVLINSLYHHGYRGVLWVGHTIELPNWAYRATVKEGYRELPVAENYSVRFISLEPQTKISLYRVDFPLFVFNHFMPEATLLIYFDPDVLIDIEWSFFEHWISYGIAVCGDKYWNVHATHPARLFWKDSYERIGLAKRNQLNIYVSNSFVGVLAEYRDFFSLWRQIQDLLLQFENEQRQIFAAIGGMNASQFSLNAALEVTEIPLSIMGADAMNFRNGHRIMYQTAESSGCAEELTSKRFLSLNSLRMYLRYSTNPIRASSKNEDILRSLDSIYGLATGRKK